MFFPQNQHIFKTQKIISTGLLQAIFRVIKPVLLNVQMNDFNSVLKNVGQTRNTQSLIHVVMYFWTQMCGLRVKQRV